MRQTLEKTTPLPTISHETARLFETGLRESGGDLNEEIANRLKGQLAISKLSGSDRVSVETAVDDAVRNFRATRLMAMMAPGDGGKTAPLFHPEAEVSSVVDSLINSVIDLR